MAHIVINAVFLDPARRGGVETYTRELIAALQAIDPPHRFTVLTPMPTDLSLHHPRFTAVACPIDAAGRNRRILWEQFRLPGKLCAMRPDLVHFPYSSCPVAYRRPMVVSIHDTVRHQVRGAVSWVEARYRDAMESRLHRRPAWVTGPSRADLAELIAHSGVDPTRTSAIAYGVDERFARHRLDPADPRAPELLWVGNPYPHKNVPLILAALRHLLNHTDAHTAGGPPLPGETAGALRLRLIGLRTPGQHRAIREVARALGLPDDRLLLDGQQSPDDIASAMAAAGLFLFPSRYESFGLPVLEAMAAGTPVIAGDIPAHRELYADAAALVDPGPGDTTIDALARSPAAVAWARAIAHLLGDPSAWEAARARGIRHAEAFTWQAAAQAHVAVYERAIAELTQPSHAGRW